VIFNVNYLPLIRDSLAGDDIMIGLAKGDWGSTDDSPLTLALCWFAVTITYIE